MSKYKHYETFFNIKWCDDAKYKKWLKPSRESNEFYCTFCRKTLSLRGKGVSALNEHMKTKLHTDNTKQSANQACLTFKKTSSDSSSSSVPVSLPLLVETRTELSSSSQPTLDSPCLSPSLQPSDSPCESSSSSSSIQPLSLPTSSLPRPLDRHRHHSAPRASPSSSTEPLPSPCPTCLSSKKSPLNPFLLNQKVTDAEIIWCMHCVDRNLAFNAVDETAEIFCRMFDDSEVAKLFKSKKDKLRYVLVYGVYPTFECILMDRVSESRDLVLMFDESHNKDLKMKQLDVHLRFWQDGQVCDIYVINYAF